MFDSLTDRLEAAFRRLRGSGRLSEDDVDEVLKEVRMALLEADVHLQTVRHFVSRVRERAVGEEVLKTLTPAQQVVKIVNEELVGILGGESEPLRFSQRPPTIIMMTGLQGSGKTTASGKLAMQIKKGGRRPLLVACDLRRPAAIQQLQQLGEQIGVPVVADESATDPVALAKSSLEVARQQGRDVIIVDTAGRLHVDEEMMHEAAAIRDTINPTETLLVVDAMTGQDAVNVATSFLEKVDYSGIILSKLDGDARGGAALSIAHVSGRPVKFASVGEKLDEFEPFHPDRMASRILGMGDVLTLIEKAEEAYEEEEAAALEEKMRKGKFDLQDFLDQMKQLKKMGSLGGLLKMIPGMRQHMKGLGEIDDDALKHTQAVILSMTPAERAEPGVIDASRKKRIAKGCGMTVNDVNALLRQFDQAKQMMKAMVGGGVPGVPAMTGGGGAGKSGSGKAKRPHRPKTHHKNKKKKRKK
ncbi:MAG TPA: signal recognition particle protein [Actinomycetota bacterium]|nr:signal recognition particle protein [Actinomycetota bacterium]